MKNAEDPRLLRGFREGSLEAFEEILDSFEKPIFNTVLRMVKNRDDALDITQTVFLKAYEGREKYDPSFKIFSWLYRIAVNESLNYLRYEKRWVPEDTVTRISGTTPESRFSEQELSDRLEEAIMELSPDYRVVIVLRHFQDCSYREIGEILDLPEKTVKSRLFTARGLLRELLLVRGIEAI